MTLEDIEHRVLRPLLVFAGPYESFALLTGMVPTITGMIFWLYQRGWGKLIMWLLVGWINCHLLRTEVEHLVAVERKHRRYPRVGPLRVLP